MMRSSGRERTESGPRSFCSARSEVAMGFVSGMKGRVARWNQVSADEGRGEMTSDVY